MCRRVCPGYALGTARHTGSFATIWGCHGGTGGDPWEWGFRAVSCSRWVFRWGNTHRRTLGCWLLHAHCYSTWKGLGLCTPWFCTKGVGDGRQLSSQGAWASGYALGTWVVDSGAELMIAGAFMYQYGTVVSVRPNMYVRRGQLANASG